MKKGKISGIVFLTCALAFSSLRGFAQADLSVSYHTNIIPNSPTISFNLGSWYIGQENYYTFSCKNTSATNTITFNGTFARVDVSGDSEFTLDTDLTTDDLLHGQSRTFIAKFTAPPSVPTPPTKTALIQVHSVGADAIGYTYEFRVIVTVTEAAEPQINLRVKGGAVIDDQATSVIDFGDHTINSQTTSPTVIEIENIGSADLTGIAVAPPACFTASPSPLSSTSISIGGAAIPFQLTFKPTDRASYSSQKVTVTSNDADYAFSVDGRGTGSEIDVRDNPSPPHSLPSGTGAASTFDFGAVKVNDSLPHVFWITNLSPANASLNLSTTLSDRVKVMNSGSCFAVPDADQPADSSIPVGGSRSFTIRFHPTSAIGYSTEIDIANDDPDGSEAPYKFIVKGTGFIPPTTSITPSVTPPITLTSKAGVYYGRAPLKVRLVPGSYNDDNPTTPAKFLWDLDGSGAYSTPVDMQPTDPLAVAAEYVTLYAPGTLMVHLKVLSSDGYWSDPVSITLAAYPNETASFPPVSGLPFDYEPPYIDGKLSGPDSGADPYGENGWQGAFKAPYADGTAVHASIELIRDAGFLYFGFDLYFDEDLTDLDQIFIGIGKNAEARITDNGKVGLITLSPKNETASISAKDTNGVWQSITPVPTGTMIKTKNETASSGNHWSAELRLPYGAGTGQDWLNLGTKFLLFVDVVKAEDENDPLPAVPTFTRFTWPRTIPSLPPSSLVQQLPEWWGEASRDDSVPSNGLALNGFASVGVKDSSLPDGPLLTGIRYRNPAVNPTNDITNTLAARVTNDARSYVLDTSGNPQPNPLQADGVRVRFKIANWGIPPADPGYWTEIAAPPIPSDANTVNPTDYTSVPAGTVAGSTVTPSMKEFILDWRLSAAQIAQYPPGETAPDTGMSRAHQCLLAEIETRGGSPGAPTTPSEAVNVVIRSAWNNMDFTAVNDGRQFSGTSEISAKGYESFFKDDEAKRSGDRRILLRLYAKEWKASANTLAGIDKQRALAARASLESGGAKPGSPQATRISELPYLEELRGYIHAAPGTISFTEYVVKAYLMTGKYGKGKLAKFEEVVPIGSYGYVVRHLGSTEYWDIGIEGANVKKIDDRTYIITIKKDETGTVTDRVKAIDPATWSFGLLGGAGFAAGNPSPAVGTGGGGALSANLSMGRDELNREYFLQAVLGFDYLPGTGGTAAWNAGTVALNFKASFPFFSWMRPYLSVGGGVFLNTSSSLELGAALGAGLDLAISRSLHLQLGADFLGSKTQALFHVNAGLIYRLLK